MTIAPSSVDLTRKNMAMELFKIAEKFIKEPAIVQAHLRRSSSEFISTMILLDEMPILQETNRMNQPCMHNKHVVSFDLIRLLMKNWIVLTKVDSSGVLVYYKSSSGQLLIDKIKDLLGVAKEPKPVAKPPVSRRVSKFTKVPTPFSTGKRVPSGVAKAVEAQCANS